MSGITEAVFDEINGVRFIDIIEKEMNSDKEAQGITVGRLTREVLTALSELSSSKPFSDAIGSLGIPLSEIQCYLDIYEPPVNRKTLARLIKFADNYERSLRGNKK